MGRAGCPLHGPRLRSQSGGQGQITNIYPSWGQGRSFSAGENGEGGPSQGFAPSPVELWQHKRPGKHRGECHRIVMEKQKLSSNFFFVCVRQLRHYFILARVLSWPGSATEITLSTHSPGCAEKIIPSHLVLYQVSQILTQTKPRGIHRFSVHWSRVTQFSVFGCLLVIDPLAFNAN